MRRNEMKNLRKMFVGIIGSFLIAGFLTMASFVNAMASETRNMVLQGGFTADTQSQVLIHNALPITVRFKVTRDGSDNNFAQRQVSFQLFSPNGAVATVIRSIGGTEETFE